MEELAMLSWGIAAKTLTFCIAAVSVHAMLRFYDRRNGIDWECNHELFRENAMAASIYFGIRIFAVTALAGAIYS